MPPAPRKSTAPAAAPAEREAGFEWNGTFYPWNLSDNAKDLMLIDRFTGMPVHEFFAVIEDEFDRGRAPILLAMIAVSVRHRHPDWSVDRIHRSVSDISLGEDITFVDGDEEEAGAGSPPEDGAPVASQDGREDSPAPSPKPNGSQEHASETSSATPA